MEKLSFTINSKPELNFRTMVVKPVELLALTTTMDLENFKKTTDVYNFMLEHVEVEEGGKWFPVKAAGREVYTPVEIADDLIALNEIIEFFFSNVIAKVFLKSSESQTNTI